MLLVDGWTIVADSNPAIGFDPAFRLYADNTYFGAGGILEPERYDVFPPDRKRARAVVSITVDGRNDALMQDMPPTPIVNKDRGVFKGERLYPQTPLARDARFCQWLSTLVGLLPPPAEAIPGVILDEHRHVDPNAIFRGSNRRGPDDLGPDFNYAFHDALIGDHADQTTAAELRRLTRAERFLAAINLFEVERDVVSGPHQDNTRWNTVTVIAKRGKGASSQLFRLDSSHPFLEYTLEPGQTLILDDGRFRHGATRLESADDGVSYRRSIIGHFDIV